MSGEGFGGVVDRSLRRWTIAYTLANPANAMLVYPEDDPAKWREKGWATAEVVPAERSEAPSPPLPVECGGVEASGALAPCPRCGFLKDTPNHELGCDEGGVERGPRCPCGESGEGTVMCWTCGGEVVPADRVAGGSPPTVAPLLREALELVRRELGRIGVGEPEKPMASKDHAAINRCWHVADAALAALAAEPQAKAQQ